LPCHLGSTDAVAVELLVVVHDDGAKRRSIAFGFQVVLGTLVNAILNDPGPLSLDDDEMEVRLSNCLLLLLQSETKAPSPKTSGRNSGRRKK
jgi:hypothetical protein